MGLGIPGGSDTGGGTAEGWGAGLGPLPWGPPAVPLPRDPSSLSRAHLATDRTIIRDLGLFLASDHV